MLKRIVQLMMTTILATGAMVSTAQERTYINPGVPGDASTSPFSGAVRVGDTLYISGMLGLENGQVPTDPAQEARSMLNSIQATIEAAGLTMDDLVHVTIYCTDLSLYSVFNEVYRSYFEQDMPARAFIGTSTLLFGARFEMQSIAVAR